MKIFVATADTDALKRFIASHNGGAMLETLNGMLLQRDGAWIISVAGDGESLRRALVQGGFDVVGFEEVAQEVDETWL